RTRAAGSSVDGFATLGRCPACAVAVRLQCLAALRRFASPCLDDMELRTNRLAFSADCPILLQERDLVRVACLAVCDLGCLCLAASARDAAHHAATQFLCRPVHH